MPNPTKLAVTADVVDVANPATISSPNQYSQALRISVSELHLWKRQAQAIGRSSKHLQAIERLRQQVTNSGSDYLKVSPKTYRVRQIDLDEFNRKALQLMEANTTHILKRCQFKRFEPLKQKLKHHWRHVKHFLERIGSRLLDYLNANSPRK